MKYVNQLFVLMAALFTTSNTYAQQAVNVQDSLALIDFYDATNGPGWNSSGGWKQGPVQTWWYGIEITGTRVTGLTIPENNLTGPIPASFGNLTELKRLSLFDNHLTSLPASFGNLTKLENVDLENNDLGSLPESFGNLTNLKSLLLNYNQLSALPESFGNLTNLEYLGIVSNQISSLPESFGSLTNLITLYIFQNQLSSLPESFGELTNLLGLDLSYNNFTFANLESYIKSLPATDFLKYAPQDTFKLTKQSNTLIAAVGGTPANNTFYWFRDDVLEKTIQADSTYTPTQAGNYRVEVTNAVATQLRLISDGIGYSGITTLSCPSNPSVATDSKLCTVVVSGIDPIVTGATIADVSYTLSGATTGSGTGSASGQTFNMGTTTVTYSLSSDASVNCSFPVMVEDKEAPMITDILATPAVLWPVNHKLQDIVINYRFWDNCESAAALSVTGNDGANSDDWQVVDANHVRLRAERSGRSGGRTYVITITALDGAGNKNSQSVNVVVPHDMSKKSKIDMQVLVLPNPSKNDFTIRVQSSSNLPVVVRVSNALGKTIETIQNLTAKGTLRFGSNYPGGAYYAEVVQGNSRAVVKLLKLGK